MIRLRPASFWNFSVLRVFSHLKEPKPVWPAELPLLGVLAEESSPDWPGVDVSGSPDSDSGDTTYSPPDSEEAPWKLSAGAAVPRLGTKGGPPVKAPASDTWKLSGDTRGLTVLGIVGRSVLVQALELWVRKKICLSRVSWQLVQRVEKIYIPSDKSRPVRFIVVTRGG